MNCPECNKRMKFLGIEKSKNVKGIKYSAGLFFR